MVVCSDVRELLQTCSNRMAKTGAAAYPARSCQPAVAAGVSTVVSGLRARLRMSIDEDAAG